MAATQAVVELVIKDSVGRTGITRFRVTDQVFPATLQGELTTLIGDLIGTGKPIIGGLKSARVIIDSADAPSSPSSAIDIRDLWRVRGIGADADVTRFQFPAASPDPTFIAAGSIVIADLSEAVWLAVLADLTAMGARTPETGSPITVDQIISQVRSRVRPRVGSTR